MTRKPRRRTLGLVLALLLCLLPPSAVSDLGEPDIRIGWTAWGDAEAISKMTALTLRSVGLDVELTLANIRAQYRGLAENNLDLMLMSWQPDTHAAYLAEYGDRLTDLGVLYDNTTMGLAVPAYVDPAIESVGDLADHYDQFDGTITGIDPEAGLMRNTREALAHYGVENFTLTESTGPAMALALERAIADERPIVVTAWRPHWKWAAHDLRYLDDPDGIFAGGESVHAMARAGLRDDHPRVAAFIERMEFDLDGLEELMLAAEHKGHRIAIREWLNANQALVHGWLQGDGD